MNVATAESIVEYAKRQKAKALRYKRPLVRDLNLDDIRSQLYDMAEECANVEWYTGANGADALEDALGDEDDAAEFRAAFSNLSADIDRMQYDMQTCHIPECFDDLMAAVSRDTGLPYSGYDTYEEDYYGLDGYGALAAMRDAQKRMMRLTKQELLYAMHGAVSVIVNYTSIRHRYDSLNAAFDILLDRSTAMLDAVREINELYEAAQEDLQGWYGGSAHKRLDALISHLPAEAWLQ